ncbi:hypothetical protein KI387_026721, partial [Taxus chinensis]
HFTKKCPNKEISSKEDKHKKKEQPEGDLEMIKECKVLDIERQRDEKAPNQTE